MAAFPDAATDFDPLTTPLPRSGARMTAIEWTDVTWNPVTGCDKVSPGCDHCYAEGIARRFAGTPAFPNGFQVTPRWDRLDQPLKWRRPRMVFVNSMSDLLHPGVTNLFVIEVFARMWKAPRHTFQVLTKRPSRLRALAPTIEAALKGMACVAERTGEQVPPLTWPLPNAWLGTSTEDQRHAQTRIPHLMQTPAATRFISAEPLLGPLDLTPWLGGLICGCGIGPDGIPRGSGCAPECMEPRGLALDWVIVGGESGPGARPMDLDWVRSIRDQCANAGVPLFVKQLGSVWAKQAHAAHLKGGDPGQWPEDLRIRQMPAAAQVAAT